MLCCAALRRTGGIVGHHKLQQYALSFAAVIKAQARGGQVPGKGRSLGSQPRPHRPERWCSQRLLCLPCPAVPFSHWPRAYLRACLPCLQFLPSKRLGPAGEAGAAALSQALDLSAVLAVRHLGLAALRNPSMLPQASQAWARKRRKRVGRGGGGPWAAGRVCLCGGGRGFFLHRSVAACRPEGSPVVVHWFPL